MKFSTILTALAVCAVSLAGDVAFSADPLLQRQSPKQVKQPTFNLNQQNLNQPVQQPAPKQPASQPGVNTGPSQGAQAIVLEVTRFSITPNAPNAGDNVQIRATIRNSGTGTVASVPWGIGPQGALTTGTQTYVMPGSSFDVSTTWTATGGQQRLQVYIDPAGNSLRNTAPSGNQRKEIAVNVAASNSNVASNDPSQNQPMQPGQDPSMQPPMQNQPMQNQPMQGGQDQSGQNPIVQMIQQQLQQAMGGTGANQGGGMPGGNQMQQQGGMSGGNQMQQQGGMSGGNQMQQQGGMSGGNQMQQQGGMSGGNQMQQQGGMSGGNQMQQQGGMSGGNQMQQQVATNAPAPSGPPVTLEIANVSITPAAPNVGDNVMIIATIRNTGQATAPSVPWSIVGLQGALTMGAQPDVPPGGDFNIVATSKATKEGGPYTLRVIIDPTGSLLNIAPEASRSSNRDIFVKPPGPVLQQKMNGGIG